MIYNRVNFGRSMILTRAWVPVHLIQRKPRSLMAHRMYIIHKDTSVPMNMTIWMTITDPTRAGPVLRGATAFVVRREAKAVDILRLK